jgi:hypothetical protein
MMSLTFPGGTIKDVQISETAGNEVTSITPGTATYVLQSVRIECTTNDTVANRYPNLYLDNNAGSRIWSSYYVGPIIAEQSGITVGFYSDTSPLLASNGIADNFNVPVPQILIKENDVFQVNMGGQAGDTYEGVARFRSFGL